MAKPFPAPAGFAPGPRPDIDLTPVTSNQVKAIGYDPATKTLAVQFNHGAGHLYCYPNVTAEQHAEFIGAKSIGAHFGQHIKPRQPDASFGAAQRSHWMGRGCFVPRYLSHTCPSMRFLCGPNLSLHSESKPMRLELTRKTKATLVDIDIQSLKMGQTEVVPAVALAFKITLANSALGMLDKTLLTFLYAKGNSGAAAQATLDGVEVVSDFPSLTPAAVMLGDLSPKESNEQTGCKLHIHVGATGHADIKLSDGTVTVKKISPKEGGAVDFHVVFYTADVDAETLGDLGVLKSHDLDVELTAPEVANVQVNLEDADGGKVTPIKGKGKGKGKGLGTDEEQAQRQADELAKDPSQRADWPFAGGGPQTPEAAFAGTDR